MLLQSATDSGAQSWVFATVLGSALLGLIGSSRAGTIVFWSGDEPPADRRPARSGALLPAFALIGSSAALTLGAAPVVEYTRATAAQLLQPAGYIEAVLQFGVVAAEPEP